MMARFINQMPRANPVTEKRKRSDDVHQRKNKHHRNESDDDVHHRKNKHHRNESDDDYDNGRKSRYDQPAPKSPSHSVKQELNENEQKSNNVYDKL
jgi:hypothetical protein